MNYLQKSIHHMDLAAAVPASLAPPGRGELGTAAFGDTREVRPSDPNQSANLQQLQSYLARFGHSKLPVQPASPAEATAARKRSFDDMLQEKMGQFWEHRERQTQAQATRSPFLPSRPTEPRFCLRSGRVLDQGTTLSATTLGWPESNGSCAKIRATTR